MRSYDMKLEKVIPLGGSLISWINTGLTINVFNWLSKFISNYGIIILILTVIIKLIILPLTYKSYMSSAKMRVLQPQLNEINERYPNQEDALKKQQAVMELYKKCGVSPMGGCIPMLIQMPILIAMFRFLPGLQLVAYCFARIAERDLFHISFGVFGACYGVGPVLFLLIFGDLFGVVEYVSEQDDADYQEADECLLIHS